MLTCHCCCSKLDASKNIWAFNSINMVRYKFLFKIRQALSGGFLLALLLGFAACQQTREYSSSDPGVWEQHAIKHALPDGLILGSSYLSIYSEVYSQSEKRTYNLTATVSMRNISSTDAVYLLSAAYYNTQGDLIRTYFEHPIALKPLESIEIVVDEADEHGGTGANFIFEWAVAPQCHEPLFEAVMISTSGQQGISFTTQGVKR